MRSKSSSWMVVAGVIIILLGAANIWYQYSLNHSPLDVVDSSLDTLDQNSSFLPMLQAPGVGQAPTLPGMTYEDPNQIPTGVTTPGPVSSTPQAPVGLIPDRLVIPAINLDAPIVPIHYKTVVYMDQNLQQWLAPNQYASGWQDTSALLGLPGNTVLNGHHNAYGKVFKDLVNLLVGDTIQVYSGEHVFTYQVKSTMILPERFQSLEVREANARWIMPSTDERLTLITCWPANGNDDRVVIVAFPVR